MSEHLANDMTLYFGDEDGGNTCHKGGRPQSPIRDLFQAFYVDPSRSKGRNKLDNITSYACKSCKKLVNGKKLSFLKAHVLACAMMDRSKKGIHSLFVYIYHWQYCQTFVHVFSLTFVHVYYR